MPVFAVSSMFFHEYACEEIFSYVSASGLTGIEVWIETPDFWLRNCPVDEMNGCIKNHPEIPSVTVHAPILDLNPCSINPTVAAVSIDYIVRSIRLAECLGAGVLTVHPGRRTAKRPPSDADFIRFDRYISILREKAGKTGIMISMENMEPLVNSLLCTPERMRELLDAEPWLYFTLDVSHAMSRRPDDLFTYIELCGDRLANVHLSRVENKHLHLPLDYHPDMERVVGAIRDCGYTGPLTLEIEDLNFSHPLTAQEKIAILISDRIFLELCTSEVR
ncbi:MAG: sugar phosphate isomerase/epimerase [Methanoregula sp.]|nr:MAG: sugar phosphate isomerase/epimerase [Methanoregula sp.]